MFKLYILISTKYLCYVLDFIKYVFLIFHIPNTSFKKSAKQMYLKRWLIHEQYSFVRGDFWFQL